MHAQQSQIILQEKLELERQLKYSNECRAEMERCLTKECQRTAMLEESFDRLSENVKETFRLLGEIVDKPMTQDQRVVIQNKYAELMEKMIDVWPLIPYLKKYSVIMPNVVEHIVTAKTRSDRIRRLIDSLVTLGDQGLHAFVRALDESGHKDLARGILAEEARLLSEAIQIPPNNLVSEQRQNENTDDNGETAILMQLQDKRFTDSEIHKEFDLPPPEVDTENCYPIGTRYFSDLKATMKHVESMLMEMAYRESLST
ncbi:hypothetical protein KUTeg_024147 [Tegillarca granosa]|uniref:CARD domain-containing protein n=1 Tax=Tegillarca granosa TaxID=220873 RepID=A0ABQ9DZK1_TEGGR|nr:hypothetical protein KUTeg_024147 [Tegillarca granosa]